MLASGDAIDERRAIAWAAAAFVATGLAPAAGLAPELPGMPAADLVARQSWWFLTATATALDGSMTLYFGGLTFQITAEGRGHSTGDLTVYIPQKRVMLMGDLLDTQIHPGQGESAGVFFSTVQG